MQVVVAGSCTLVGTACCALGRVTMLLQECNSCDNTSSASLKSSAARPRRTQPVRLSFAACAPFSTPEIKRKERRALLAVQHAEGRRCIIHMFLVPARPEQPAHAACVHRAGPPHARPDRPNPARTNKPSATCAHVCDLLLLLLLPRAARYMQHAGPHARRTRPHTHRTTTTHMNMPAESILHCLTSVPPCNAAWRAGRTAWGAGNGVPPKCCFVHVVKSCLLRARPARTRRAPSVHETGRCFFSKGEDGAIRTNSAAARRVMCMHQQACAAHAGAAAKRGARPARQAQRSAAKTRQSTMR